MSVSALTLPFCVTDILKAHKILPRSQSPSPPPDNLPGPSRRKDKGKGVKREREEDNVIEILSDDEGIKAIAVIRTTSRIFQSSDCISIQNKIEHLQGLLARKKARKSVKQEAVSVVDLT